MAMSRGCVLALLLVPLLAACWSATAAHGSFALEDGPRPEEHQPLRRLLQEMTETVPPYRRGADYPWILSEYQREDGMTYMPAAERLRTFMDKLAKGQKVRVSAVGGSITAGQGARADGFSWPQYVFNWLDDMYPGQVSSHNGAVPSAPSGYMAICHSLHVPPDSDLIFVEFSANDDSVPAGELFLNPVRRGFERLLRQLLAYPNAPAVVLVHSYVWHFGERYGAAPGTFWSNAERDLQELAKFYRLPSVSVKACCYHAMKTQQAGFSVTKMRKSNPGALAGKVFYYDSLHPDGLTGSRVTAELAMHLMQRIAAELKKKPLGPADTAVVAAKLPEPMIPDAYESPRELCSVGRRLTALVAPGGGTSGWDWVNDSKVAGRPKWGFVATAPGSVLRLRVNATASGPAAAPVMAGQTPREVLVELVHLKSFEGMGEASLSCAGGCKCMETKVQGHAVEKVSHLHLHRTYVSESPDCELLVTVLPTSRSGGNKVKVRGLIVSAEAGRKGGIGSLTEQRRDAAAGGGGQAEAQQQQPDAGPVGMSMAALEYVIDFSQQNATELAAGKVVHGAPGLFDVRNLFD